MVGCDDIKNTGRVHIEVIDEFGRVKKVVEATNLVVDSGLQWIAARLTGAPAAMSAMAAGSSSAAVVPGDTALHAESGRVGIASSTAGAATTYTATFPAGTATGTVSELGIFNPNGTMLNRVVFAAQQKGSGDTFKVTWVVTQSS